MRPPTPPVDLATEGPVDGVRPHDHPDVYWLLLRSTCLIQISDDPIMVSRFFPWHKMCRQCYNARPIRGINSYVEKTQYHSLTSRLYNVPWEEKMCCIRCNAELLHAKRAVSCSQCIETYLDKEDDLRARDRVRMNYESEITRRN
ncbi:PREDICTED: uncharacterized protein LOC105556366 [Vollenhovia emeryi]|uniref:uncharacterized protein LOC105556366 n=1 Tax=Vollenhovia emeryi TaxID=411798 RepID=UPI0005F3E39D|nr:PREDICTED: uncharacterized protein LOC105556366 [Vollenhovia emeryi]